MKLIEELLSLVERIAALSSESPGMSLALAFDRPVGGETAIKDLCIYDALRAATTDPSRYVKKLHTYEDVLLEFVADVDVTGGMQIDGDPSLVLCGAPDWPDLAVTYIHACKALGCEPLYANENGEPMEDDK